METVGDLGRLVALQMTNQMPGQRQIVELRHFRQRFLDIVFAKMTQSGLIRRPDNAGGPGFTDRQQLHGIGFSPRLAASLVNTLKNRLQME